MLLDRVRGLGNKLRYPRVVDYYRDYFRRRVPGRTVIDVGAMWSVDGAYAFAALDQGAAAVTAVDVSPATPRFQEQNAARGDAVRFVQGDLMDAQLIGSLGTFDVVFCCGVIYHLPDPMLGIQHLRRLCAGHLLLGSRTIGEGLLSNRAIFYPHLSPLSRRIRSFPNESGRIGLDTIFKPDVSYANWFWGLAPSAIGSMLKVAGFRVEHVHHRPTGAVFECALEGSR